MAAYLRVYDSRLLQADCQEPGSARYSLTANHSAIFIYEYSKRFVQPVVQAAAKCRRTLSQQRCSLRCGVLAEREHCRSDVAAWSLVSL